MATVTRKGTASSVSGNALIIGKPTVQTLGPNPHNTYYGSGLIAGEPIKPGAPCFVAQNATPLASDGATNTVAGKVYMSQAVANKNLVHGYAEDQVFAAGEPVTLRHGVAWDYIASTYTGTPGAPVYLSATSGEIADSTTATYGTTAIGNIQPKNSDFTAAPTGLWLRQFLG